MKTRQSNRHRFGYQWIILIVCCLSQGGVIGISGNCTGLFYVPVCEEFGCSTASISLFSTISGLASCLGLMTIARKFIFKYPVKIVLCCAGAILCSRILLAYSTSVWQWWIAGAISGFGYCFLAGFTTSIVLERWFVKKLPTALSVVASFSGLFGIVMSAAIGSLIQSAGWRTALSVSYLILFVLVMCNAFMVMNPYEKKVLPYGADEAQYAQIRKMLEKPSDSSLSRKNVTVPFNKKMVIVVVLNFINTTLTAFIAFLSPFGSSINVRFNPSLFVSSNMAGNLLFKLIFGRMVEKMGVKKSSVIMLCVTLAGEVLLLMSNGYVSLVGAFLFGASALIYTSMIPLIERFFYDSDQFPAVVQKGLVVNNFTAAFMGLLYGAAYDALSSYSFVIVFMVITTLVNIVLVSVFVTRKYECSVACPEQ